MNNIMFIIIAGFIRYSVVSVLEGIYDVIDVL